jgi:membrane-associated protease RseP (regulator of RpoE activity)
LPLLSYFLPDCLQVITLQCTAFHFPKRTIWLIKILALIIGAGGVFGVTTELGTPWLLAVVPSASVIFIALRERVEEVIPTKPVQDASAYRSSWEQYRKLRTAYLRSSVWPGAAFLCLIIVSTFADRLQNAAQIGLLAFFLAALIVTGTVAGLKQLKLIRWACPRCGCAFRGLWGKPWMPKNCVYCGLPREANTIDTSHANSR